MKQLFFLALTVMALNSTSTLAWHLDFLIPGSISPDGQHILARLSPEERSGEDFQGGIYLLKMSPKAQAQLRSPVLGFIPPQTPHNYPVLEIYWSSRYDEENSQGVFGDLMIIRSQFRKFANITVAKRSAVGHYEVIPLDREAIEEAEEKAINTHLQSLGVDPNRARRSFASHGMGINDTDAVDNGSFPLDKPIHVSEETYFNYQQEGRPDDFIEFNTQATYKLVLDDSGSLSMQDLKYEVIKEKPSQEPTKP